MPRKQESSVIAFCICRGRIPGQSPGHALCGPERTPGLPSPCPLPEGEGKKKAPAYGATSRRLRAWLRPGPEINWGARTV